MFGLFGSWKSKTLKTISARVPIAEQLWVAGTMAARRIEDVRTKHAIPNVGTKNLQLFAFHGGVLEASVRMLVDANSVSTDDIGMLVLSGAVYTAVKNDIVTDESSMHTLAARFEQGYFASENTSFRLLGIGAGGLTSGNAELFWAKLDEAIVSGRVVAPELGIRGS